MPLAGPPPIPPPVTPPPPGTPPPGALEYRGADGWRWYHAAAAFVGGFVVTQIVILLLAAVWSMISGTSIEQLDGNATFTLIASACNEVLFILASYFVARIAGPVSARDFGLRSAPFWPTLWRMAVVMLGYFALLAVYSALVDLKPDTAPDKLGASTSDIHMLMFAVLVGVLAPIAEEILFRGFLFRALRNGIGVWGGAIVSGLLFGALHIDAATSDRLLQVVPLAVLGISFALLYNWTGTLYAPIALHATNNSIAVAAYADKHNSELGMILAGAVWALMMLGCALGPRLTDRNSSNAVPYPSVQ